MCDPRPSHLVSNAAAHDVAGELQRLRVELERLRLENREWEYFFIHGPSMLCVVGPNGRVNKINRAFEQALAYSEAEFIGLPVDAVVHPDDIATVIGNIANNLGGSDSIDFEMRMRPKGSEQYRWYAWTCPGKAEGAENLHAIVRDVTASKEASAALMHEARHDSLTGLANRAVFNASLVAALARAQREPGHAVGLLLIDLDGFKAINDQWGHSTGDEVLRQ